MIGELGEALADLADSKSDPAGSTVTTQRTITTRITSTDGVPVQVETTEAGPIITEIGDEEAARIEAAPAEVRTQVIQMSQAPPPGFQEAFDEAFAQGEMTGALPGTAVVQESHQVLPDGTLQHTVTKVTTTTFVQGTPLVECALGPRLGVSAIYTGNFGYWYTREHVYSRAPRYLLPYRYSRIHIVSHKYGCVYVR